MGERQLCKLDVAGSIPAGSTEAPVALRQSTSLVRMRPGFDSQQEHMKTLKKWFKVLYFWKWRARFGCHRSLFPCQFHDAPTDNT